MSISSTVVDRADIRFHAAAPALQPYVGCFWVITAECGGTVRVVPDGTTSIAIEQQQNRGFDGYLRGPLLRPVELRFTAPTTLIGVRLRPGVAFILSGVAVHSMVDRRARCSDYGTFVTGLAGFVTACITQSSIARLIPGIILLIAFIPQHAMLWDKFPLWYHLSFLLSLVPLTYIGNSIARGAMRQRSVTTAR